MCRATFWQRVPQQSRTPPGWSTRSQSALIGANPAAHYREHAETIAQAWSRTPDVAGAVVAAAMRAAAAAARSRASRTQGQPGVDRPIDRGRPFAVDAVSARTRWSQTQRRASCWCRSRATTSPTLTAALAGAIDRGVEVMVVLETPDAPGGPLVIGPAHPFAPIKDTAQLLPMAPRSPRGVLCGQRRPASTPSA